MLVELLSGKQGQQKQPSLDLFDEPEAMLVIGVQKKLATLLGRPIDDESENS